MKKRQSVALQTIKEKFGNTYFIINNNFSFINASIYYVYYL